VLFIGNGIGSLVAAIGILRERRAMGWLLGALVAGGAVAAYIASRTVGLPGLPAEPENWLEPMGVVSLVCEAAFLAFFALSQRARPGLVS
jgi:hypothetical protein